MLKDFIENRHFIFADSVENWEEAIKLSCKPFIDDATADEAYAQELVESVKKYGAYIVLMPGVALPHSQEGSGSVHKTSISFMKLKNPVSFDENDADMYADLFFTLASCNHDEHLKNMAKLSEMLLNEELVEKLHKVKNEEDLKKLSDEFNI